MSEHTDETDQTPEHEFYAPRHETDHGNSLDVVACTCGEWEWDSNDNDCRKRWAEHVAEQAPTPHRIDIHEAIEHHGWQMSDRDRGDLLAVLYAWRDEAVTDALRAGSDNCCPGCAKAKAVLLPDVFMAERARHCERRTENDYQGMRCDVQYGSNPDRCYLQFSHRGPHSNRWGTTWTDAVATPPRAPS